MGGRVKGLWSKPERRKRACIIFSTIYICYLPISYIVVCMYSVKKSSLGFEKFACWNDCFNAMMIIDTYNAKIFFRELMVMGAFFWITNPLCCPFTADGWQLMEGVTNHNLDSS